eukprot:TRINITY_DN22102_c0_g1_i2.p1 TRINITY_DN22102_c0_g1~~TRINITY_DN22102_c0_g1_i2.p1  ORF type:complete len:329 (-),score=49.37 TRINITY_DN22102_c0_g1_i2:45-1031(-)
MQGFGDGVTKPAVAIRRVALMRPRQLSTPWRTRGPLPRTLANIPLRKFATATMWRPMAPAVASVASVAAIAATTAAAFKQSEIRKSSLTRQLDTCQGPGDSTMFVCSSLDQWHSPEAESHQGFLVTRPVDPLRWQIVANQLTKALGNTLNDTIHQEVIDLESPAGEDLLRQKCQDAANALAHGFECVPALKELVSQDAKALADATLKLVPHAKQLTMKLEVFGTNTCSRWHQDQYVCRSIVSYNCSATQYTADSNVNFNSLCNGAPNDDIIRDSSRIRAANVGDMMLMKGAMYPGSAQALVHKSPEIKYHDGQVQARLVLKVDVQDLA